MPSKNENTPGTDNQATSPHFKQGFDSGAIASQDTETHFRNILDSLPDWVWEVDRNGFITYSNLAVEQVLGYSRGKLTGKSILTLAPVNEPQPALKLLETQWGMDDLHEYQEHVFVDHNGIKVMLETCGMPFYNNADSSHSLRFITRPVRNNNEASRTAYAAFISENLTEAAAIMDEELNIVYINPAFTELFGYTEDEILGQPLTILGAGKAINTILPVDLFRELEGNQSWQGEVKRRHKGGYYIPCMLSAKSLEVEKFKGYIGTYLDLRNIKQTDMLVKSCLKKTINAICKAIDDRNILKGQHQEKVTDLAIAIALEMGQDYDFIEGLTLAAHLHDLGEMYLPPEITSKNGPLTDVEMLLIKSHPQKSYDILKDIPFPWPVPEIILQHHERYDGSGYPNQIAGTDIRLEARILSVADTVGTMLSDRPYRPACTLAQCIVELEEKKGILYDPLVVDVCLRLFREKNYSLKAG